MEKLLLTPIPINKAARRVVKAASLADQWAPDVNTDHAIHSREVLAIKPVPKTSAHMEAVIGRKRDRLTVLGLHDPAKEGSGPARWVVRCDCGNYEVRKSILRWLGTHAPDMCLECRTRVYKMRGDWSPRDPAKRDTKEVS